MRRPFTNLTLDERRAIARLMQAKVPKTKIAVMLGRNHSTITREIKELLHPKMVPAGLPCDSRSASTAQTAS